MKVVAEHINPNREIKEGVLVRWSEYPDRLYVVKKTGVNFCGNDNCCKLETIDNKFVSIVPIKDLVWDDVDYIEVEK